MAGAVSERDEHGDGNHELAVAIILALAGFGHLAVGERATLPNGVYAERTEFGIFVGGGR